MKKFLLLLLAVVLVALPAAAQQTTQPIVTAPRPTAFQLLQASAAGTTWAPVTIGGDLYVGASPGLIYASGLTGSGGTVAVKSSTLQWSSALTPIMNQAALTTASGTGAPFTFQAQNETGTSSVGGSFVFQTGTGTAANGSFQIQPGGSTTNGITYTAGGSWQWQPTATPFLLQSSTASATSANMTLQPQASTATNGTPGNVVIKLAAPTGTGAVPQAQLFNNTQSLPDVQFGLKPGTPTTAALYLDNGTGGLGAPGAANYVTQVDLPGNAWFNVPYGTASGEFSVINSVIFRIASGAAYFNYPVTGDPAGFSAYGVHGYVSVSVAGSSNVTLTAAQYSNDWIDLTGALTGNIVVFLPAQAGMQKKVKNLTSGAFTVTLKVTGDTGSGVVITQGGARVPVMCNNSTALIN